jgi:predicted MFS family arabinose efflux permease
MRNSSTPNIILVLAASGFAGSFSSRVIDPMIAVMAVELSVSVGTMALLSAAFALPYAFAQPILGPVGDAVGKERVIAACLTLLLGALIAAALSHNATSLFVARAVAGASAGGAVPLSLALIGDKVPLAERRVALSRYMLAVIAGQLAGSSVSGVLVHAVGWHGVFALCAALMALALLVTFASLRFAPTGRAFDLRRALCTYRGILADPRAVKLFFLAFLEGAVFFALFPYLAPVVAAAGGTPAQTGLAIAGFAVGGLLFSLGVSRALSWAGPTRLLVAGGAVAALGFVLVGTSADWRALAAFLLLLGLGYNALHNAFQTQATELAPAARASAVALFVFSFFCGQGVGVLLMGVGLEHLGLSGSAAVCALLALGIGLSAARGTR